MRVIAGVDNNILHRYLYLGNSYSEWGLRIGNNV